MSLAAMKISWFSKVVTETYRNVGVIVIFCSNENESASYDKPHNQGIKNLPMRVQVNIGGSYTT
jgi:hypothetical protein